MWIPQFFQTLLNSSSLQDVLDGLVADQDLETFQAINFTELAENVKKHRVGYFLQNTGWA